MKNLIIIPAYNEQESIEKTVEDIKANAPRFDYIVVNDCSKDNTGKICREKKYNVINLPVNLGIGGAVQTGYRYAWKNGYETAVQVDGDGQHDPKFLEMSREFDPENLYSVPYTWGTVGILYNTKTIEERGLPVPKKWSDLWNPAYKGEILMQDSVRDAFMVALKARGYSMNRRQKPI